MSCLNSTASGCRCPEHHPGLSVYATDPDAYTRSLTTLQPTRLRVVTPGPDLTPACTGGYTCPCPNCLSPSARPRNRKPIRQPWQPITRDLSQAA